MRIRTCAISAVVVLAAAAGCASSATQAASTVSMTVPAKTPVLGLHVHGNQIVNGRGQAIRLIGFNNSGAEYACEENWGIFDTPTTNVSVTMVKAMKTWTGVNAVRLPVDEQCWLGLKGIDKQYAGINYQRAIEQYVTMMTSRGLAVILDLAGTAPGNEMSANQEMMPDSHSVAFWHSAALAFRGNPLVLFDLFNEPWPDNDIDSTAAWECWKNGGCIQSSQNGPDQYRAVGMQQLVNTVRATGARNIVIAEGIEYAEFVDQWLKYEPHDPDGNLISSVHVYSFNGCSNLACYNGAMLQVARKVPMLVGEIGPNLTVPYTNELDVSCPVKDIGHTAFDSTLLNWARVNRVSWTAWSWNAWGDCWSLLQNTKKESGYYSGLPTSPYGLIIRAALRAQRQSAQP
jgi:endoglucanase